MRSSVEHKTKGRAAVPDEELPTIEHGSRSYTVLPLERCAAVAESLQSASRPWHSHALWPGCIENPFPDFGVVIESQEDGKTYVAQSDVFPEVDKVLVRMLHGDEILDPSRERSAAEASVESTVLDLARVADANGTAWHHHMCFPDCVFNPEPGRWTISVESGDDLVWDSWESEPADVLWQLEILCFSTLAADSGAISDND